MATDGPTPEPCNPELYKRGVTVGVFETFGANHFEGLIKQVAFESGCPVDWHYCGGRAIVKAFAKDADVVTRLVDEIIKPAIEIARANAKPTVWSLNT